MYRLVLLLPMSMMVSAPMWLKRYALLPSCKRIRVAVGAHVSSWPCQTTQVTTGGQEKRLRLEFCSARAEGCDSLQRLTLLSSTLSSHGPAPFWPTMLFANHPFGGIEIGRASCR